MDPSSDTTSLPTGHIANQTHIAVAEGSGNTPGESAAYTSKPAVGGIWIPVDKFGLLAPYIGVASTILVATVATAIYVKRVKRRKEKR